MLSFQSRPNCRNKMHYDFLEFRSLGCALATYSKNKFSPAISGIEYIFPLPLRLVLVCKTPDQFIAVHMYTENTPHVSIRCWSEYRVFIECSLFSVCCVWGDLSNLLVLRIYFHWGNTTLIYYWSFVIYEAVVYNICSSFFSVH